MKNNGSIELYFKRGDDEIGETVANDSIHARGRLAPAIYLRETFPPERKVPMPLGPYTIDST